MQPVIEAIDIWKEYNIPHEKQNSIFSCLTGFHKKNNSETLHALRGIHFTVEKGEIVGIIGRNGSGKSTLLKVISHIITPTRGEVIVRGKITPLLELGIGFQPDLTVKENIVIYGVLMKLKRQQILEKLDSILEFAELERFRDTKLKKLSSGMVMRIAFSTAIHTDPEILLVDEILSIGDLEFQKKCIRAMKSFHEKGVTIIAVTHNLTILKDLCPRAILLEQGSQLAYDDAGSVINSYYNLLQKSKAA